MNKRDTQMITKVIVPVIGSVIVDGAIAAFYAWIITLAFPFTFWQAFVIALAYLGILNTLRQSKK